MTNRISSCRLNLLKKEGFVTETAGDGDAALEKVRSFFVPDLVLLDVMMPKKSV